MKNQAFFSLKDKSKKLKCLLLQFLFGALRDNGKRYRFGKEIYAYKLDYVIFQVLRLDLVL